jgi:hypothetical protein
MYASRAAEGDILDLYFWFNSFSICYLSLVYDSTKNL